ncbi:ParA family protein [Spirillospora sp. NPDC050679]
MNTLTPNAAARPDERAQRRARVTVFANHKGGVGKTFLLMVMAAELAMRGFKVLVVDLDPQANASRRLGYAEHELETRPSIAEAVADSSPDIARRALLPCQWDPDWADNITLLPSRIELENRVSEAGVPGSWMRLEDALTPLLDDFDYVLVDTQPTLGHLLHLALVLADDVIAPAVPEYDAVRGAQRLMDFVSLPKNRRSLGIRAEVVGVVMNAKRSGVATHEGRVEKAVDQWGSLVWQPALPLRAPFHDTQEFAEPPHSASGEAGTVIKDAAKMLVDRYLGQGAG